VSGQLRALAALPPKSHR